VLKALVTVEIIIGLNHYWDDIKSYVCANNDYGSYIHEFF